MQAPGSCRDLVLCRRRAAAVIWCSSAIAMKYSSCLRFMQAPLVLVLGSCHRRLEERRDIL